MNYPTVVAHISTIVSEELRNHCSRQATLLRGCLRFTTLRWVGKHVKYYETDELPNPRPTQPKKKIVQSGIWTTFSHIK